MNKLFKDRKNALIAPGAIYHGSDSFGMNRLYSLQDNSRRLKFTFLYEVFDDAYQVFLNTAVFLGGSDNVTIDTLAESYDMIYNSDLGSSNNLVSFSRRGKTNGPRHERFTSTITIEPSDLLQESEYIRVLVVPHTVLGTKSTFRPIKKLRVLIEDVSESGNVVEYSVDLTNNLTVDAGSIQFITISNIHSDLKDSNVFTKVEIMPTAFYDDVMLKWLLRNFSSDIAYSVLADLNAHEACNNSESCNSVENRCSEKLGILSNALHGSFLDRLIQSSKSDKSTITNLFKK